MSFCSSVVIVENHNCKNHAASDHHHDAIEICTWTHNNNINYADMDSTAGTDKIDANAHTVEERIIFIA